MIISQDFQPLLFSQIEPTWSPDSLPKAVQNNTSISPRYLAFKLIPRYGP
jgi:hypothetical protein